MYLSERNPVQKNTRRNLLLKKWRNLPLRTYFVFTVLITFCIVLLLSGLIIWGCMAFRHFLLPDSDSVYLTIQTTYEDGRERTYSQLLRYGAEPVALSEILVEENGVLMKEDEMQSESKYSIQNIETTFDRLSPKRKLAYQGCAIIMVAAPAIFSLAGILVCSIYFYRRKLYFPLQQLSEATKQIALQNLDFTLEYDCEDEMGDLCRSFSQMQKALSRNNKKLWKTLEESRRLQASVAHDLRNPIAIVQGYTEYLETKITAGSMQPEKALRIVRNLNMAAKRLERYTESVHCLSQLEDIEINPETLPASRLAADLAQDFSLIARQNHRILHFSSDSFHDAVLSVDTAVLYRVLENIIGNSLRFSKTQIFLNMALEPHLLSVTVGDDGCGFPDHILKKPESRHWQYAESFFSVKNPSQEALSAVQKGEHLGIGLSISRILCEKHGGFLSLSNLPSGGAVVKISLKV